MHAIEAVVGRTPLRIRRRVKWGECDPAGVVYTVTFAEYVASAAELFYERLFAMPPQAAKRESGFGTPSRALEFEFMASLWPDDEFDMTVTVLDIGRRTFKLEIAGAKEGVAVFTARLTPICIARGERKSIDIPPILRSALECYRRECREG